MKRPHPDNFKSWNEKFAHKYDPDNYYSKTSFLIRFVEQQRIRAVRKMLDSRNAGSLIEIGCGAGHILEKVAWDNAAGLDISDFMLQKAKRRLSHKNVDLLKADAEKLPFKDGCYDNVICTEVLEHVLNPDAVIDEISRISHEKTSIMLSIPNENLINFVKKNIIKMGLARFFFRGSYRVPDEMNEEWHLHIFDLATLRKMLKGKFVIQKISCIPFAFLPLRYVVKCKKAVNA